VYPYTDEQRIAEAVCLYASSGISNGEAVVVIATGPKRQAIERRLRAADVDVDRLTADGQLILIDAEQLLAKFMIDGMPDAALFKTLVDSVIFQARVNSASESIRKVRLFGEMVNLLWCDNPGAALSLEELWNEVVDRHSVPILCAYSLGGQENGRLSPKICETHSHTVAPEILSAGL
jgi:hypothetical protein